MSYTVDNLLNGRVILEQPSQGYRVAIDPVLLAAAVPAREGQSVLDLGCGVGAAMFCLAARVPGLHITGVERHEDYLGCAERNRHHNAALGDFTLHQGDATALTQTIRGHHYDHVMANPPYFDSAAYDAGRSTAKTAAHAMPSEQFALWVKTAHACLKHHGTFTVVYHAAGLANLIAALNGKFGGLQLMPLWPKPGHAAKRVIIQGQKDSKAPLQLLPGIVLHHAERYSAAAEKILRHGQPLLLKG